MKRLWLAALLMVSTAHALSPREVVNRVASDMNLTRRDTNTCYAAQQRVQLHSIPVDAAASIKYVNAFSFVDGATLGLDTTKSLLDITSSNLGLLPVGPWEDSGLRGYVHASTLPYAYYIFLGERTDPSNEYLKLVEVCVVVVATVS